MLHAGMVTVGGSSLCLTVGFVWTSMAGDRQMDGVVFRDLLLIKHPVYAVVCVDACAFERPCFTRFSSTRILRVEMSIAPSIPALSSCATCGG